MAGELLALFVGGLALGALGLLTLPMAQGRVWVGGGVLLFGVALVPAYVVLTVGGCSWPSPTSVALGGWQWAVALACVAPAALFLATVLGKPGAVGRAAAAGLGFLAVSGAGFVWADSLLVGLVCFELLLLTSAYLLRLTSKSERIGEAVAEMFFWTLAGSLGLLAGFVVAALAGVTSLGAALVAPTHSLALGLLFGFGFGVKLPVWPCFSWLLKAHVEASVEFSILLSGAVVKFGAFGVYRYLGAFGTDLSCALFGACCLMGVVEAVVRVPAQRDLKRVVALTTVVELNWVGSCVAFGGVVFEQLGAFLLVAHSLTTCAEFFVVECIYRRYHSRDLTQIAGLYLATPLLWVFAFCTTLVTIGFPGTSLFAAKLYYLTALVAVSGGCFGVYLVLFVLVLPLAFVRLWVPVWFGARLQCGPAPDLTSREAATLLVPVVGALVLGLWPALAVGGA